MALFRFHVSATYLLSLSFSFHQSAMAGQVQFKADRFGMVHVGIGKVSKSSSEEPRNGVVTADPLMISGFFLCCRGTGQFPHGGLA